MNKAHLYPLSRSIRSRSTPAFCLAAALLCMTATGTASAQTTTAKTIFQEGVAHMKRRQFEEACPKFAESHALEPASGTILNLARCNKQLGRLATALANAEDAITFAVADKRVDREISARALRDELRKKVPKIVINVASTTAGVTDLTIKLDGDVLTTEKWGVDVPLDPGKHVLSAMAPGREPMQTTVKLEGDGGKVEMLVELAEVKQNAPAAPPPPPPEEKYAEKKLETVSASDVLPPVKAPPFVAETLPAPRKPPTKGMPPRAKNAGGWTLVQSLAVITGGIGLSAIAVGAGYNFYAMALAHDDLEKGEWLTAGKLSTALLVGGLATTVGAGTVLALTVNGEQERKHPLSVKASLGLTPGGAILSGQW